MGLRSQGNPNAGQVCIVNRATAFAVPAAALTRAKWDSVREDLHGWFDNTNQDKIVVAQAGVYVVTIQSAWTAPGSGEDIGNAERFMHIERIRASDGVQEVLIGQSRAAGGYQSTQSLSWVGRLLAGDGVRVVLFQNTAGALNWGFGVTASSGPTGSSRSSGNPVGSSTNCEFGVARIA